MNKKDKLKSFVEQHIKWVYLISGVLIAFLIMLLWLGLRTINFTSFWSVLTKNPGSLAEWVSGIGTLLAFFVVFWQINKQTNIQRALDVEHQRPRFAISTRFGFSSGNTIVVYDEGSNSNNINVINTISNSLGNQYQRINIRNISNNNIYSIEVAFFYYYKSDRNNTMRELFDFNGLRANQNLLLFPKFEFQGELNQDLVCSEVVVKFTSSAEETGFVEYNGYDRGFPYLGIGSENYYYVKNKNKNVRAHGQDQMISEGSETFNKLNGLFNGVPDSTFVEYVKHSS